MADRALLALLQTMLGGSTAQEQPSLVNEVARRLILASLQVSDAGVISGTMSGASISALNASNLSSGTVPLARLSGITNAEIAAGAAIAYAKLNLAGAILNADINASAAIDWSKISKSGSNLTDIATRSATDLTAAWSSWTPTITNLTIGDGVIVGRTLQIGKLVFYDLRVTWGSTTSASGTQIVPAPAQAATGVDPGHIGSGMAFDTSSGFYYRLITTFRADVSNIQILGADGGSTFVNATSPFAWANGDILAISGFYPAA